MPLALDKRAWNTIWLPVRVAWTALYGSLDAVNTLATLPKQAFEIVSNTTGQIKDVFSNAWNTWKRYNKLVNVPLSPFIATWTAVEWAVRAVVNPTWNAITHTRDVAWNVLVNAWNSLKWALSSKPVSDFKYEHLKTSDIWKKNYISKRQWISSSTASKKPENKKEADKKEEPPKAEDKKPEAPEWQSEKEITLEKKVWDLEAKNKWLESIIEKLIKQQEETNKKLAELLSGKNEDWGKIIKWDFKKWSKENTAWEKAKKRGEINKKNIDNGQDEDEDQKLAA